MVNAEGRKRKELEVMEKGKKKKGRMLMMYSHETFVDFRYEMVTGYHVEDGKTPADTVNQHTEVTLH